MTTAVSDFFNPGEERMRRLRQMKLTATGLLLLALALFISSYLLASTGQGDQFLRAASEAAMVGGLADWFAVTALFRRPLGLPIPHTALIPTKKDQLAESLGGFITEHFLDAENLAAHLETINILGHAGRWLTSPTHARQVTAEASRAASTVLESLSAEAVTRVVVAAGHADMKRRSYAAATGELVELAVVNGAYEPLAAVVFEQLAVQLRDPAFVPMLKGVIESGGWLSWLWATDRRTSKLLQKAAETLQSAALDHSGPPWPQLRDGLLQLATLLKRGGATAEAFDDICRRQLDDPALRRWLTGVIDGGLDAVRAALADPDSGIGDALTRLAMDFGRRAQFDEPFRATARDLLTRMVLSRVEEHPDVFVGFVTGTVAKWDAEVTSRRIEQAVGRDLQFIRINGTVVGALAGLAIHAFSLLL